MNSENDGEINNLFKQQIKGFETKAIRAGQNIGEWKSKCIVPPIVTSVTFQQSGINEYVCIIGNLNMIMINYKYILLCNCTLRIHFT